MPKINTIILIPIEIKRTIDSLLADASKEAEKGNAEIMEEFLLRSLDVAKSVGIDLRSQAGYIARNGYLTAARIEFDDAKESASEGDISDAERFMEQGKEYAVHAKSFIRSPLCLESLDRWSDEQAKEINGEIQKKTPRSYTFTIVESQLEAPAPIFTDPAGQMITYHHED
jgi:hypothetical protein